jgi:hypothetical protein
VKAFGRRPGGDPITRVGPATKPVTMAADADGPVPKGSRPIGSPSVKCKDCYLEIEMDEALGISEQVELLTQRPAAASCSATAANLLTGSIVGGEVVWRDSMLGGVDWLSSLTKVWKS